MARQFAAPYRRPDEQRFAPEHWVLGREGIPLEAHVSDWDYQQDFVLSRQVTVDLGGVREDCRLGEESRVRFSAGFYCPDTHRREYGIPHDVQLRGKETVEVQVSVTGREVSGSLNAVTEMTLLEPGSNPDPLSPSRPGARLWRDARSLRLEGSGSRFPVELVAFESAGGFPNRAGWRVDWGSRDLDRPVLGTLRLLVNTDVEKVAQAVSGPNQDSEARAIASAIRYDVARRMIFSALRDDEFCERSPNFPDESLGAALRDLISLYFGSDSLDGLVAQARHQPERLEARIQDALRIFD